jgi:flagellum-specific ATP synthase
MLMSHAQVPALLPGAAIVGTGLGSLVPVGDALMGRVIDATGRAIDDGPPVRGGPLGPIAGAPIEPLARAAIDTPLWTGVRAIDALATLGRGQRIGLIAGAGVGKSTLLGMIAREAVADAIVVALVGERGREVADFFTRTLPAPRRRQAVVVAAAADQPPVLRIRAALRACAIAEAWRARGRHVLLLLDSLTRIAHAQRELGLALGEPASARGYPPSALGLIARLAERAGACRRSGGSVTAVLTVLADGDDATDPVVDSAKAILDGHIVLDRGLAERGILPAVDPARSLSRCMAELAAPAHLEAARRVRRLHATWEGNRDLIAMGAWKRGGDPELDAAVDARPAIEALLRQSTDAPVAGPAAVDALVTAFAEPAR